MIPRRLYSFESGVNLTALTLFAVCEAAAGAPAERGRRAAHAAAARVPAAAVRRAHPRWGRLG